MRKRLLHNSLIGFIEKVLEKSFLLSRMYIAFFTKMTIKEFSIVPIPEDGKVLVIGCGSIPHTLIILGLEKSWKLTGIDRDIEAVKNARSMVERYGLKGNIIIVKEDGLTVDLSGYDLVIISYDTEPKGKVIRRIVQDIDNGTFLLYRTTWEILDRIYGAEKIPDALDVKKVFYRSDLIKSILMVRDEK